MRLTCLSLLILVFVSCAFSDVRVNRPNSSLTIAFQTGFWETAQ